MKNIIKKQKIRVFLFALFLLIFNSLIKGEVNEPRYILYPDLSGQSSSYNYDKLNEKANLLSEVLPIDAIENFKVIDCGFYVFNDLMKGGVPAIWNEFVAKAKFENKYFILFGREYSSKGESNEVRVHIELPISEEYSCSSIEEIEAITNAISAHMEALIDGSQFEKVLSGLDSSTKLINHMYNCCNGERAGLSCDAITLDEAVLYYTNVKDYKEEAYLELENITNVTVNKTPFTLVENFNANVPVKVSFDYVENDVGTFSFNLTDDLLSIASSFQGADGNSPQINQQYINLDEDVLFTGIGPSPRSSNHSKSIYYEDVLILEQGGEIKILFRLGDGISIENLEKAEASSQNRFLPLLAKEVAKRALLASVSIGVNLICESTVNYAFGYLGSHIKHFFIPECDTDLDEPCETVYFDDWSTCLNLTMKQKTVWSYMVWAAEGAFNEFLPNSPIKKAGVGIIASGLEYILSDAPFTWTNLIVQTAFGALISVLVIYKSAAFLELINNRIQPLIKNISNINPSKIFQEFSSGELIQSFLGKTLKGQGINIIKSWHRLFDFPNLRSNTDNLNLMDDLLAKKPNLTQADVKAGVKSAAGDATDQVGFYKYCIGELGCFVRNTPVLMANKQFNSERISEGLVDLLEREPRNGRKVKQKLHSLRESTKAMVVAAAMPIVAVPIQEVQLLDYAVAHETVNSTYGLTASVDDNIYLGLLNSDPYTSDQQRERDEYEINDTDWNEVVFEELHGGSTAKLALHNDWINQKGYQVNGVVNLDLPEQGISGPFKITLINHIIPQKKPIDEDESDDYNYKPVTALFTHVSNEVYNIDFDNGESLSVTYQHPIYSTTINDWKLAGELEVGEKVLTYQGEIEVERSSVKGGVETVYNLEVKGLHNFLVGDSGVVVHNSCSFSDLWKYIKDFLTSAGNHGIPSKITGRMSHKLAAKALKLSGKKLDDFADAVQNADWNKIGSMGFEVNSNGAGKIIIKGDSRYRTPTYKQNVNKTQGNIETKGSNISWQQIDEWKSSNQVNSPPGFYSNLHTDIDI